MKGLVEAYERAYAAAFVGKPKENPYRVGNQFRKEHALGTENGNEDRRCHLKIRALKHATEAAQFWREVNDLTKQRRRS